MKEVSVTFAPDHQSHAFSDRILVEYNQRVSEPHSDEAAAYCYGKVCSLVVCLQCGTERPSLDQQHVCWHQEQGESAEVFRIAG